MGDECTNRCKRNEYNHFAFIEIARDYRRLKLRCISIRKFHLEILSDTIHRQPLPRHPRVYCAVAEVTNLACMVVIRCLCPYLN